MTIQGWEDLNRHINEGTLVRRTWGGSDSQGRQTACLLAALSPEVRENTSPDYCPASIMPKWLAYLTPWIDDTGTLAQWPVTVRRYAAVAARWHVLDAAAWQRAEYACRAIAVREAMEHNRNERVREACERFALLCEDVSRGAVLDASAFAADAAAAADAAYAAAAADAAAADRMHAGMLGAIEAECTRVETELAKKDLAELLARPITGASPLAELLQKPARAPEPVFEVEHVPAGAREA